MFEVGACYDPAGPNADIGGDWYDCFTLGDDLLALAVGDVAGHGLGSAALMVQLRNALRAYAVRERSPAAVVTQLNQFLVHLDTDSFATLVYAVYQPSTGTLCWTHAGHPPALRFSIGHHQWLDTPGVGGPVLGVWSDATYSEATTVLDPGEGVLFFTDGLIERRDSVLQEGLDRLSEAVEKSIDLAEPGPLRRHGPGVVRHRRPRGRRVPTRSAEGGEGVGTGFRPRIPRSELMSRNAWSPEREHPHQSIRPPANRMTDSDGPTYEELYEKAKQHNIKGRSKMSKTELERALGGR